LLSHVHQYYKFKRKEKKTIFKIKEKKKKKKKKRNNNLSDLPSHDTLDVPPSSVRFSPHPTEARSAHTVWRDIYGRRHSPKGVLSTPMRVLSMRRDQLSCKGLSPLFGRLEVNHRAIGGVD